MIRSVTLDWRFGKLDLPADDQYIRQAIERTGEYSGGEIDLYEAILRPGDVAIDVGANVGIFSIAIGRAVGPSGRVLAFEPQPPIFEFLQRNLATNGLSQVEARRAIVAAADGEGEFVDLHSLPPGRPFNFGSVHLSSRPFSGYGGTVATPMLRIDSLGLERCDFMKIDVEGAEALVVAGALRTVAACRPLLSVECDRPDQMAIVVDALLNRGYRLWRFRGFNMRVPNPKGAGLHGIRPISILMLLAVPEERLDRLDAVDRSALQTVGDRAAFERLSRGIVREEPA